MRRQQSVPLGKIFGIPIGLDLSWFLIFAYLMWSLSTNLFPQYFSWPTYLFWVIGGLTSVVLFASVLLHELGHALVAMAYHVPVRRIRLLFFGGIAELGDEPESGLSELLIALAGPIVSFVVAFASGGVAVMLYMLSLSDVLMAQIGQSGLLIEALLGIFAYTGIVNLMLGGFNLIPGFPLDGGRVLRALIWMVSGKRQAATQVAGAIGRFFGLAFIGLGVLQMVTGSVGGGLWSVLIGLFLQGAAAAELRASHLRSRLSKQTVSEVMGQPVTSIPADISLDQLMRSGALGSGWRVFTVTSDDGKVGILTAAHVSSIDPYRRRDLTAGDVMQPIDMNHVVNPASSLWPAFKKMELMEIDKLAIVGEDGQFHGYLRREDIIAALTGSRPNGLRMPNS